MLLPNVGWADHALHVERKKYIRLYKVVVESLMEKSNRNWEIILKYIGKVSLIC
jgi:hypothetical protein